ncbi:MAG: hypothetical protein K2X27_17135 [Candidatus Obscuribacterales bacterium]|nr:hypothetical protein [Candidatus Obscuribacterales bacterium]
MGELIKRVALGSGKGDPMLQEGDKALLLRRHIVSRIFIAATVSLTLAQQIILAQNSDNKKPGLEPVTAGAPSKSAMTEPATRQTAAQTQPKPEAARSSSTKASDSQKTVLPRLIQRLPSVRLCLFQLFQKIQCPRSMAYRLITHESFPRR